MAVLKKGDWKAPFMGISNNYSSGRDSLGLQTTSQASYSTLLPGLTNLTNRIRYYGFYCWLLEMYAINEGDTDPKVQNRFMRRGEYMIALLMQVHEKSALQIPGSTFAAEETVNHSNSTLYDLSYAADISKDKKTYWQYSSGAFGQYYAGALQSLGLIVYRDDSPVFVCTSNEDNSIISGTLLAKAFEKNISKSAKELFLHNIQNGVLKISDTKSLFDEFAISHVPLKTEEWNLYTKLLFTNDLPLFQSADNRTYFRKNTLLTVLSYIDTIHDAAHWDYFYYELYNRHGLNFYNNETESSFGWYYYQLNEYWHFAVESIFWALLHTLSTKYFQVQLVEFLNDFHLIFVKSIFELGLITDENQTIESIITNTQIEDARYISDEINKSIKDADVHKTVYLGFKMLIIIYKQNFDEFNKLRNFAAFNGMERDGDCISGLIEFSIGASVPVKDFLTKFLLKNLINRHLEVAYRKMGSGIKNTLKFSYEDNFLKHVETIYPVWTTPRIYAMHSCFKDLGYIDNDGSISNIGKDLISI